MNRILERSYKNGCCERVEQWLIDTDAEVKTLPKAPPGSSAVSAESGITFYTNTSGEWPTDPSKYASAEGGSGGGGGVSSWNDLTDKPFGEVTTYGDTLTWDGNTEGLEVNTEVDVWPVYKVSEAVPTLEELSQGGTVKALANGQVSEIQFTTGEQKEDIIILKDSDAEITGVCILSDGIYFGKLVDPSYNITITSLTINGYESLEVTEVKTIDPKYLPAGTGGGETFEVEFIQDSNTGNMICSKTLDEILTAIETRKNIYAFLNAGANLGTELFFNFTLSSWSKEQNIVGFSYIGDFFGYCIMEIAVGEGSVTLSTKGITVTE